MNHGRSILLIGAGLLAVGLLGRGAQVLARQRAAAKTLRDHIAQLQRQLSAQRHPTGAAQNELKLAESELAQLPAPAASEASSAARARAAEIASWLARVKQLKQLFAQHAEQCIPEMRLLKDDDWLRVAKRGELDTEEGRRTLLASLRETAKSAFAASLSTALRKYVQTVGSAAPDNLAAVAPFLEDPAAADILARYEVADSSQPARNGNPAWEVQEMSAVDPDYDDRASANPNGGFGSMKAPFAWIPNFRERMQAAYKSYALANQGSPPAVTTDVLPYVNPPFDSATVEKILTAEKKQQR